MMRRSMVCRILIYTVRAMGALTDLPQVSSSPSPGTSPQRNDRIAY